MASGEAAKHGTGRSQPGTERCSPGDHASEVPLVSPASAASLERATRLFRALGEVSRLRLVARLAVAPACVSELAVAEGEAITTISQRLRVLRADHIVRRRREGKHMLYYLADRHVLDLISNGLAHVSEEAGGPLRREFRGEMDFAMALDHKTHDNHPHEHGTDCGHTAVQHDGHTDYLHDGHLHHMHEGHVDEHVLEVSGTNPAECTNGHACDGHEAHHVHGKDCGHEAVPHGDHVDYLVKDHLHHQEKGHCDNHGPVTVM